jgi:hypothetical protein
MQHVPPKGRLCSDELYGIISQNIKPFITISVRLVGLRGLEVAFPPHDPSDAGSIPVEVVEFFRAEKFGKEVLRKGL